MNTLYDPTNYLLSSQSRPPTWERAEANLRDEYDLVKDRTWWHDSRKADDTPVELKSCACQYADGRLGRFKIWQYQLDELMQWKGEVGLLVYVQSGDNLVLATHILPVHELRHEGTVSTIDHSTRGEQRLRRIKWTDIIPLDKIRFGSRHYFLEYYSQQAVDDAILLYPPEEAPTLESLGSDEE